MIELKNINKTFKLHGRVESILKNINLTVDQGERVAILGPSGAGKSTLMNIIGLLDPAYSGQYWFDGQQIHSFRKKNLAAMRNREIGFIFQQYQLLPAFSIEKNIKLPWLYGTHTNEDYFDDIVDYLGIKPYLRNKPHQLSGGQQQRVAIARAMINRPNMILADEPTGALDQSTGNQVIKLLEQQPQKTTVITITHNHEIAERFSRTIHLKDGELA